MIIELGLVTRKHWYGKMGAVLVPGTLWVRILLGYRCMRTPGVPVFGQKKIISVRFWYESGRFRYKASQNGIVEGKSQTVNIFPRFFLAT